MAKTAKALALLEEALSTPHGVEAFFEGSSALAEAERLRHLCYSIRRVRPEFQVLRLRLEPTEKGARLRLEKQTHILRKVQPL